MTTPGAPDAEAWQFEGMSEEDLDEVLAIERDSFLTPWTRDNFRFEIRSNPFARNDVVRKDGRVVAYACVWIVGDELKINNIAVHRDWRRRGLGTAVLLHLLRRARAEGCADAELEVRPSNLEARRLYERHGFRETRRRKGYYQDTREDALVMVARLRDELA